MQTFLRPPHVRRSWLFLSGADKEALMAGRDTGADVLVQELETFTPPARRPAARSISPQIQEAWRQRGIVTAVRVNPLNAGGDEDLRAAMQGRPNVIMMSFVSTPEQVAELDAAVTANESALGIPHGTTELVPNIESCLGLINTMAIAKVSPRVTALLVATEDMVADLGAERTRSGSELNYVRSRFLTECAAAKITAIDCPYSYADREGAAADMKISKALGFKAKAIVDAQFVEVVNQALTATPDEIVAAKRVMRTFESARAVAGDARVAAVVADGRLVEVPDYLAARRIVARAEAEAAFATRQTTTRS
jgi:citrate lyase subunit beta / citryl-CoA lyase